MILKAKQLSKENTMNKVLLGIVAVVVVVGGYLLFTNKDESTNTTNPPPPPPASNGQNNSNNNSNVLTGEVMVDYNNGYTPATFTIKKGTKVTFHNKGTGQMWPASAPHPTHTDYPEFDPKKAIASGQSWSFTFDKTGTFRFHDHLNSSKFGSITVVE
jgi:plastocyanin